MRRELSIAQPELSNEVLPPDSGFVAPPEPLDLREDGAGDVWAGVGRGVTGATTAGAGVDVTGAETGAAGVAAATDVLLGSADASAACETALVAGAVLADCAFAEGSTAAVTGAATGGELARRTGIAGPADVVEMLEAICSCGVLAGRSERPSAKKPPNTATLSSIASAIMREYVATGPRSASNDVGTRTVFMTGRRSVWSPPGSGTGRRVWVTCRRGSRSA